MCHIRSYGPFWVCTTLVFVTAVAGNYAHFLEWRKQNNMSGSTNGTALSPPPSSSSSSVRSGNHFTAELLAIDVISLFNFALLHAKNNFFR